MTRLAHLAIVVLIAGPAQAQPPQPAASAITLEQLEQLALENNPTGMAAAAGIDAARGRTRQAGAFPNPLIGYSGEEIKTGELDRRGEHGFFMEQTIPLGGKLRLSQVLVAQGTFFELSTEYLDTLDEAWRAALQLQGFLAGDGLDAPAPAGESAELRTMGRGGER